jgi:fluoride exporter
MMRFFLICLGGAVGTGTRFALSAGIGALLRPQFPYGTITVNILGSFLMGAIMYTGTTTDLVAPALRLVLTTGFLGGFTTYSAFNSETVMYLQQNLWGRALANVGVTVIACLVAGFAGIAAARRLVS